MTAKIETLAIAAPSRADREWLVDYLQDQLTRWGDLRSIDASRHWLVQLGEMPQDVDNLYEKNCRRLR